jgi:MFS family permease
VFSVIMVRAFVVGFALLGAITFLPTYLQYVKGVSATVSGLRTLPLVIGLLITSIGTGTIVGRTGRYKIFPIAGFAVMTAGLYLLSRLSTETGFWATSGWMLVLGIGIGLAMQVLTIIVQNTARYSDLGVATSAVTFFRTLGSSFGTAVFGAIYSNGLASRLASALARSPGVSPKAITTPETLHRYPDSAIRLILAAYSDTLHVAFLWGVPVAGLGLPTSLDAIARRAKVPAAVLAPAFDHAISAGYLTGSHENLALTKAGDDESAKFVRQLKAWVAERLARSAATIRLLLITPLSIWPVRP